MVLLLAASHTQALLACLANLPSDWSRYRHDPVPRHVHSPHHARPCAPLVCLCQQLPVLGPDSFLSHNIPNSRDPRRACLRCSPIKALIPL